LLIYAGSPITIPEMRICQGLGFRQGGGLLHHQEGPELRPSPEGDSGPISFRHLFSDRPYEIVNAQDVPHAE
jgi:hypothetical protein